MSHCVVPKRYPYLPPSPKMVLWFEPATSTPPSRNFHFSFMIILHLKKKWLSRAYPPQFSNTTLVVGTDIFWKWKIEKKYSEIFKALFFHLFPHATALTHKMSYSFMSRLIRNGVTLLALITEPKSLAFKRPFLTKCQEGLFLSTFNFHLINSTCSAAVDKVRHSSEKLALPLLRHVDPPVVLAKGLTANLSQWAFHTLGVLNTALLDLLDLVVGVRLLLAETCQ